MIIPMLFGGEFSKNGEKFEFDAESRASAEIVRKRVIVIARIPLLFINAAPLFSFFLPSLFYIRIKLSYRIGVIFT